MYRDKNLKGIITHERVDPYYYCPVRWDSAEIRSISMGVLIPVIMHAV